MASTIKRNLFQKSIYLFCFDEIGWITCNINPVISESNFMLRNYYTILENVMTGSFVLWIQPEKRMTIEE